TSRFDVFDASSFAGVMTQRSPPSEVITQPPSGRAYAASALSGSAGCAIHRAGVVIAGGGSMAGDVEVVVARGFGVDAQAAARNDARRARRTTCERSNNLDQ